MKDDSAAQKDMASAARAFFASVRQIFSLRQETDYDGAIQQIRSDIDFRSGNTWALVFAILIASVGLNVNSIAVIIGAMLISPLMGPITGIGFGLATNDLPLMRRGLRNLFIAASVGLVVSTIYFSLSPLEGEQSELLARTRPTLYDVMIALFGGSAGIIAATRKSYKGNVVPGVAIATALIPPLCTAGFGLAQRSGWFFLGAMHLFLINALFICLASVGFVRLMQFERAVEFDAAHLWRTRAVIALMVLLIGIPSLYTGWTVVQEARFQRSARRFVSENLNFTDRVVVSVDLRYTRRASTITATLFGQPLPADTLRSIEQRLPSYGLERVSLRLNQPVDQQANPERITEMVRQGILDDLFKRNEEGLAARDARIRALEEELARLRSSELPLRELANELASLYPALVSIGAGRQVTASETASSDLSTIVVASWRRIPNDGDQEKLRRFLTYRLGLGSLRLVNVVE